MPDGTGVLFCDLSVDPYSGNTLDAIDGEIAVQVELQNAVAVPVPMKRDIIVGRRYTDSTAVFSSCCIQSDS